MSDDEAVQAAVDATCEAVREALQKAAWGALLDLWQARGQDPAEFEVWRIGRTYAGARVELLSKVRRDWAELRDRRNDLLEVRGILSPQGEPRKVPMPLVPEVAPAVEWLVGVADAARDALTLHSPKDGWEREWKDPAWALEHGEVLCAGCKTGTSARRLGDCPVRKILLPALNPGCGEPS